MDAKKSRILIVEDEAIIAMELAEQLKEFGYEIVGLAHSSEEALTKVDATTPDLVMLDIVLGEGQDGIETAEYIRRTHNIPFIYLSAFSDANTVERAAKTAPYGYLTKPYQVNELRASIEVALTKARLERELDSNEFWFTCALRAVDDAVFSVNADGYIHSVNLAATKLLNKGEYDIVGQHIDKLIRLGDKNAVEASENPIFAVLRTNRVTSIVFSGKLFLETGHVLPVDYTAAPTRNNRNAVLGAVLVIRDVSQRASMERALLNSEARFHQAFIHAANGMALIAMDGRFIQINPAFTKTFGLEENDLHKVDHEQLIHPEDLEKYQHSLNQLVSGEKQSIPLEIKYLPPDGQQRWIMANMSLVEGASLDALYLIIQYVDLTERKHAEKTLHELANNDPLTGLINRTSMMTKLNEYIADARRNRKGLAVFFIDLDNFKDVNDTFGHHEGDNVLLEAANLLTTHARARDIIARYGGDEFVLIAADIDNRETAEVIAKKIVGIFGRPFTITGHDVLLGASVGVSLYPEDGLDSTMLLRNADTALYAAKRNDKNRFWFYDPAITEQIERRLFTLSALREALKNRELYLAYQPILNLKTSRIQGVEALVRWQYQGRHIPPSDLIPIAETSGLIIPLGEWVIEEACQQLAKIIKAGHNIGMGINVSPRQFRSNNLTAHFTQVCHNLGIHTSQITVEITEDVLMEPGIVLKTLLEWKKLGIQVAIDDFGTGFSSFSYLKKFTPNILKIDRSFVEDIEADPGDAAIVSTTISIGRQLGMVSIAEGVETEKQFTFLKNEKCDHAQGFFLAKPMPADNLMHYLNEHG